MTPIPRHLLLPAPRLSVYTKPPSIWRGFICVGKGGRPGFKTKGNRMKDIIIDRIVFSQEPDTNADQDDCQRIDVEFLDNGGGHFYYRISTDGWAIDESSKVLDFCKKIVAHN